MRRRRLGIRSIAATLSVSLGLLLPSIAPAAFTEFALSISPGDVAAGPHGAVWFTEASCLKTAPLCRPVAHRIGKITTNGKVTEYSAGISGTPVAMTAGPDGNMWFTERLSLETNEGDIAKMTSSGLVTEYKVTHNPGITPDQTGVGETTLGATITAGPDGNLWFTGTAVECTGTGTPPPPPPPPVVAPVPPPPPPTGVPPPPSTATTAAVSEIFCGQHRRIAKITTGGAVTEYVGPEMVVSSITAGREGKLWFTQTVNGPREAPEGLGNITTAGTVTEYSRGGFMDRALDITAGPDGNLWFTENLAHKIAKITPSGAVTEYTVGNKRVEPLGIRPGPDGNLWFTAHGLGHRIGRITTSGKVSYYNTAGTPTAITASPDGNLWFGEMNPNRIVELSLPEHHTKRK